MKIFKPYKTSKDTRGLFLGIINSGNWEEINYIETVSNQIRGGHYHKNILELFFIIEGEIDITITDINNKLIKKFMAKPGMIFLIEQNEGHIFKTKNHAKWINALSKRIDDQFHDIYKINKNI